MTLTLSSLSKTYPRGIVGLRETTLAVEEGELLVLLGPSGCGKTTLLRLIAGLETPTTGSVAIARGGRARDLTRLHPAERGVGMVFQEAALYPHMTARENIAFPLRRRGVARSEVSRRVSELAEALSISGELGRRPAELSGGQRQRVAIGRAVVRDPEVLLLDEPLSGLDAPLRAGMRALLRAIHDRLGCRTIWVTHDVADAEAAAAGGRATVAVMGAGRIVQSGTLAELREAPADGHVAAFVRAATVPA